MWKPSKALTHYKCPRCGKFWKPFGWRKKAGLWLPGGMPPLAMAAPWRFLPCVNCCEGPPPDPVRCDGKCSGLGDNAPGAFRVTISGIQNGTCSDCAGLNGIYDIPWWSLFEEICWWSTRTIDLPCNQSVISLTLERLYSPDVVALLVDIGNFHILFGKNYTDVVPIDCCALEDEDVPCLGGDPICDASSATCTVTALCPE